MRPKPRPIARSNATYQAWCGLRRIHPLRCREGARPRCDTRIQKRFSLGSRCCTTSSTGYSSSFCQRSRAHAALRTRWAPSSRRRGREEGYRTAKVMISPVSGIRPHGRLGLLAARVARKRPRAAALNDPLAQLAFRQPQAGAQCGRETADEFGSSTCLRNSRAQSTASRGAISRRQRTQKAMPSGAFLRKSSKMSVPCVRNRLSMSSPSGKRTTLQDSPRVNSISHARSAALRPGPVAVEKQLHMRRKP